MYTLHIFKHLNLQSIYQIAKYFIVKTHSKYKNWPKKQGIICTLDLYSFRNPISIMLYPFVLSNKGAISSNYQYIDISYSNLIRSSCLIISIHHMYIIGNPYKKRQPCIIPQLLRWISILLFYSCRINKQSVKRQWIMQFLLHLYLWNLPPPHHHP